MRAYDFDNTIFLGDSTVRFYLFCLARTPKIAFRLPRLALDFFRFSTRRIDKTAFKQNMFSFLQDVPDVPEAVELFWRENYRRIVKWYLLQKRPDDVIISASPEFLLRPVCRALDLRPPIASRVDMRTGRYTGLNCSGEEKVRRFRELYGDRRPDVFYSDSHSDDAMAAYARKSLMVYYIGSGDNRQFVADPWPFPRT